MSKKRNKVINFCFLIVFIGVLMISLGAKAQPVPCNNPFQCPAGCKPGGIDCWDPDDPVPLDNGLLLVAGVALAFGLYKLNRRRQFQA